MASGPYFNAKRGDWRVEYFDGTRTRRPVVGHQPHWKPGMRRPINPPPEIQAAFAALEKVELEARTLGPPTSMAAFLADYRERALGEWQPRTAEGFDRIVRYFLAWCEENGVRAARDLDGDACRRWIADRIAGNYGGLGPVAASTTRKERVTLKAAWGAADNPWDDAPLRVTSEAPPKGSWSPGEYARLLAECDPWLRDLIVLGCHTGIRVTALLSLEWSHVDTLRSFGRVPKHLDKGGKGYELPLHARVKEVLERRRKARRAGEERIMYRDADQTRANRSTPSKRIIAACARAGLPRPDGPNHQCRRTFGRWAVLGHLTGTPIPMYVIQRWYGHSSITVTQSYLNLGEDDSSRFMETT